MHTLVVDLGLQRIEAVQILGEPFVMIYIFWVLTIQLQIYQHRAHYSVFYDSRACHTMSSSIPGYQRPRSNAALDHAQILRDIMTVY